IKQIFYCFGCGKGGDVFNFVMDLEKSAFPEAVRTVAEKCGIAIPRPRERSPEERQENQQRSSLVEMHREAQAFLRNKFPGHLRGRRRARISKTAASITRRSTASELGMPRATAMP